MWSKCYDNWQCNEYSRVKVHLQGVAVPSIAQHISWPILLHLYWDLCRVPSSHWFIMHFSQWFTCDQSVECLRRFWVFCSQMLRQHEMHSSHDLLLQFHRWWDVALTAIPSDQDMREIVTAELFLHLPSVPRVLCKAFKAFHTYWSHQIRGVPMMDTLRNCVCLYHRGINPAPICSIQLVPFPGRIFFLHFWWFFGFFFFVCCCFFSSLSLPLCWALHEISGSKTHVDNIE